MMFPLSLELKKDRERGMRNMIRSSGLVLCGSVFTYKTEEKTNKNRRKKKRR